MQLPLYPYSILKTNCSLSNLSHKHNQQPNTSTSSSQTRAQAAAKHEHNQQPNASTTSRQKRAQLATKREHKQQPNANTSSSQTRPIPAAKREQFQQPNARFQQFQQHKQQPNVDRQQIRQLDSVSIHARAVPAASGNASSNFRQPQQHSARQTVSVLKDLSEISISACVRGVCLCV